MPRDIQSAILIDPHPLWLDALDQVVSAVPLRVLASVPSLAAGAELIERLQPDVAIVEIAAAADPQEGLAWVRDITERVATRIVLLTTRDDREYIHEALFAGATAYALKTAHPDDLVATVRQALEPSIYFAPVERARLQTGTAQTADSTTVPTVRGLTPRELEILRLAAEGHSNARLARMLWVTEQTVKFHLSNIYRKIGVSNRTEAGRWAQLHGLVDSDPDRPGRVA
jgi:DNA-binding NarL/FixJ family response regulator